MFLFQTHSHRRSCPPVTQYSNFKLALPSITMSSDSGMMQHHFKLYAAVQPYEIRYIPADVRAYTSYVLVCLMQILHGVGLLLLSPFLYLLERYRARQTSLPLPYRHILVTGASSGVGEHLAYSYAAPSVRLTLVARNEEQLNLVATKCRSLGADVQVALVDVTDRERMERTVTEADAVRPLDLVLAVAGHESAMGKNEDLVSASRQTIEINILGMLNTILPAIPAMRQRRRGQLVVFSSQLGFLAAPLATDYDSAKVCIRLYGEGLRCLLRPSNVAVNVVVPGAMETPMMNTLTERAQMPTVPLILPVSNALLFIREGLARNVGVISYPSVLSAWNSAVGAWPPGTREMFLSAATTDHHVKWRMGEVDEYRYDEKRGGKKDDYYVKERQAETERQRANLNKGE